MVTLGRKIDFTRIGDMLVDRHDICAVSLEVGAADDSVDVRLFLRSMKAPFIAANLPASLGHPALNAIRQFLTGRLEGEEITKMFDECQFGERADKKE